VRRVLLGLLLVASAVGGGLLAVVLAAPTLASGLTETTTGTTTTETTTTVTTTTGTTTTTPPPPPRPATIAAGVRIGGVNVGGLSPETASAVVRTAFNSPLPIILGGRSYSPHPKAFGAVAYVQGAIARARIAAPRSKVKLVVRVRGQSVRGYIGRLASRFDRPAVDSTLFLRKLRPFITKEKTGQMVDRAVARRQIVSALLNNTRFPIDLRVRAVEPEVTRKSFGPSIVIRRSSNQLYLYQGNRFRKVFRVATGQARYPTPLGRFEIVVKWLDPWWYPPDSDWARGAKPIPPGPGNPLGTRWMGLSSPGVGIHGTPDPGSIGYSVSHGCIRMQIPEAEWLFQQVEIGTPVFIVAA
jgi:lipoprotein-anchoring transpeptidase ErfK/SrfK